jgi:hypothetical protein
MLACFIFRFLRPPQLALTAEHGFRNWHFFGQIVGGQALAFRRGYRWDKSTRGDRSVIPGWVYVILALSYLAAKEPGEGLAIAAKGLGTADYANDAYLYRSQGELLLMTDSANAADTETSLRAAIATASKQSAKYDELSATRSLARLLAEQGRRDEAPRCSPRLRLVDRGFRYRRSEGG